MLKLIYSSIALALGVLVFIPVKSWVEDRTAQQHFDRETVRLGPVPVSPGPLPVPVCKIYRCIDGVAQ